MFDDLKVQKDGRLYSGMNIGSGHVWNYQNAVWEETKLLADKWQLRFTATKHRQVDAPEGSGVEIGSQYHWLIIADQVVRKTTANEYETEMTGSKYKIGHRRPYWRAFSYAYPGQMTARQKTIAVLKETLAQLEQQEVEECQKNNPPAAAKLLTGKTAASAAAVRR